MKMPADSRGFTLLEVFAGMVVFVFGILALYRLQAATLRADSFSNDLIQASVLAQAKMEALMVLNYGDAALDDTNGDGMPDQDRNKNGVDDDDEGILRDGHTNFGLDKTIARNNAVTSDGHETDGKYDIYWNIAVDQPVAGTKTIRLFVTWRGSRSDFHRVVLNCVKTRLF